MMQDETPRFLIVLDEKSSYAIGQCATPLCSFGVLGPRSIRQDVEVSAIVMIILCRMFSEVGSSLQSRGFNKGSIKCVV